MLECFPACLQEGTAGPKPPALIPFKWSKNTSSNKEKPFSLRDWIFPPPNPPGLCGFLAVSQLCSLGDGDSGAEPSRKGEGRTGGGKIDVGKVSPMWIHCAKCCFGALLSQQSHSRNLGTE